MSIDTYPPQLAAIPLPIALGGTGGDDAVEARSNLGCGTMATQNANAVAITGGTLVIPYASMSTGLRLGDATAPGVTLDVKGNARISNQLTLGLEGPPFSAAYIGSIYLDKSAAYGLGFQHLINDTGAGQPIVFRNMAAGTVGIISTNATTTTYGTTSDARLKHAIEKLVGSLDIIRVLNPIHFLWNANDEKGEGFLAHELQHVIPQAVTGESDALNEDDTINPQQVDYSKLVPRLVGALQELLARVEALEARLV